MIRIPGPCDDLSRSERRSSNLTVSTSETVTREATVVPIGTPRPSKNVGTNCACGVPGCSGSAA